MGMNRREDYVHGGDVYRTRVELDYSVNINPLGMPPAALQAAKRGVELSTAYPDWKQEKLREALTEFLDQKLAVCTAYYEQDAPRCRTAQGPRRPESEEASEMMIPRLFRINKEEITFGNGAADLIHRLMQVLRPPEVIVAAPSFSEYSCAAERAGAKVHSIRLEEPEDFAFCKRTEAAFLEAVAHASAGAAVFLCNPNNPDGNVLPAAVLLRIASACEKHRIRLIVDECFLPFLPSGISKAADAKLQYLPEAACTMLPFLRAFPHLIVLRAFTKIYGMPGLRLGYMLTADPVLNEAVRSSMTPWEINLPAQLAGAAALKETEFTENTRALIRTERRFLVEMLPDLPYVLKVYVPVSDANFILFRTAAQALDLKALLLSKGVLIRACGNYEGLDAHFYRICVRTREENRELLRRWRTLEKS